MEAPEVPLEQVHEDIHHHSKHSKEKWTAGVALSTAILAALAAICSLFAGHHANEAMLDQIRSSDHWAYYQAKGIKAAILMSKIELLQALQRPVDGQDSEKALEYRKEQEHIRKEAEEEQKASQHHLRSHVILARGVTMFQVAIAIAAISILTQKRRFWLASLGFGLIGILFLGQELF